MPLVRIELVQGRTDGEVRALADAVQEVMEDVFAAPDGDRYQVITEHPPGRMILGDSGLGIDRDPDGVVLVQVLQQGRDAEQKTSLYTALAQRLEEKAGVRPQDLVVAVSLNGREDCSFGHGRAQFLTGEL
ncbi:tautomerase family protein [Nocardioides sp. GY 10127]|uniref:tautomerase family protein n=1 Tax=Nocardioides sp. GY 10127 TaxID=2569762 RepID=UPI0010A8793D|nr:tautomerase family protein [Nocardioides sp. GY 10127]TIC84344.1 tautomerase family protein [Nocardioides sp. GY 10127]